MSIIDDNFHQFHLYLMTKRRIANIYWMALIVWTCVALSISVIVCILCCCCCCIFTDNLFHSQRLFRCLSIITHVDIFFHHDYLATGTHIHIFERIGFSECVNEYVVRAQ